MSDGMVTLTNAEVERALGLDPVRSIARILERGHGELEMAALFRAAVLQVVTERDALFGELIEARGLDDAHRDPTDEDLVRRGNIVWHSSGPDEGPDVGISLGLGEGRSLYIGEITSDMWEDADDETKALGNDSGAWLVLYDNDGGTPLARFAPAWMTSKLMEIIATAIWGQCDPDADPAPNNAKSP